MLIELGNHATKEPTFDGAPAVTYIHFPEADDSGVGGYSHVPGGISVSELKDHLVEATVRQGPSQGVTRLPDHEMLVSVLHLTEGAWSRHGVEAPRWVNVVPHPDLSPDGHAEDLQSFLEEYWRVETQKPANFEDVYHTKAGTPGVGVVGPPPIESTYTNNGRVISNINDGGGQVGAIGVGSASTGTSLTVSGTPGWASNQFTGYRIVVYSTTSNNLVWGNVTANGTGTNPSVTVDRWYNFATPGGAAGTSPTTPWAFALLDGGFTSTWFVGLATGANATAAADTTLATNGNAEITTVGGGLIRKIAPYAQTSGVASRAFTLTPVYTANGTDTLPAVVTTIGVFCSMVSGTAGTMKFETTLNASATLSAIGDQLTVTESVTGS